MPANLVVQTYSASHIELTWTASSDNIGVAGYRIFRDNATAEIGVSAFESYVDTALGPNETHTYRVQAFDAAGNRSNRSNIATGTTGFDTTPPSQPLGLTAVVS